MRVLLNAHAGGDADLVRQAVRLHPDARLVEADDLAQAAAQAAAEGEPLVVAAGGDGTVHAVANGLLAGMDATPEASGGSSTGGAASGAASGAAARPALGVLPAGTGNDLARTLGIPLRATVAETLDLLARGERRTIDAIRVTGGPRAARYAVNACSGGFTGEVDSAVTPELKSALGPLAYAVGTARALPDLERYHTTLAFDGGAPERVHATNVLVAGGRTVGGGTPVAPMASLEDGLLDVVVVLDGHIGELARVVLKAYTTGYTEDAKVLHRRVREVTVASEPPMQFNVDGDLHAAHALTFAAVPGALRAVVGPDYVAQLA